MTYSTFVLKNTFRNKKRLAFTVLSIGFSLFLLIALFTVLDMLLNPPQSDASILRLATRRSTSLADQLPLAYEQKIKNVPGVKLTMPFQWFGGYYQEPKNFFANLGGDPYRFWEMFPEIKANEATKAAWIREKTGAVVGTGLMERYGWHVGQRVTLKGTYFPIDLDFIIVGTYDFDLDKNAFYFRFDYLNEALGDPGTVGTIWSMAESADKIPAIMEGIDSLFRNTSAETKTETEKAFQLSFTAMLGNVRVMIGSIALVVVFTMLLVTASTMAMTIRERMREVAILKSIGFSRAMVLALILGEAVLIGCLGMAFAWLMAKGLNQMDLYTITQGFLPRFVPPASVLLGALGTAVGIGLISGLIPALQASNMRITRAMRQLE